MRTQKTLGKISCNGLGAAALSRIQSRAVSAFLLAALTVWALLSTPAFAFEPTGQYAKFNINGWTVLVSSRFANQPREQQAILRKIQAQTAFIVKTLPAKQVRVMRKADIWVEPDSHWRALARHHVSKAEIYQEGLNVAKYRDIEIFGRFAKLRHPTLLLHELAHVYHDRGLGFQDRRIERLYEGFRASMPTAKDRCGVPQRAYALHSHSEFFATFTEAFFAKTCSYPYNRDTIRKSHPQMFAFLSKVWGER